jgi:NAD(P)-dependent dehydrogenase (short-subunit alcohol dehydrogenase family)
MTQKIFWITGAASGLGRALTSAALAAGHAVFATDVQQEKLEETAKAAGWDRHSLLLAALDVRDGAAWERAEKHFLARWPRLDVMINNAGILLSGPLHEVRDDDVHRMLDINVKGVINGCQLALPYLQRTPQSRVINLCSASALFGQPMLATYSASKAAVRSLTEALDIEWQRHGIRVVDVLPLFVNTAMVRDDVSKMKTVQALGVHLTPEDIARQIWRLAQRRAASLPVHTPVGWQTTFFYLLSKHSPDAINRFVTARMAGY